MTYLPIPPIGSTPNAGPLTDADLVPVGQSGITRRATLVTFKAYLMAGASGATGSTGSSTGASGSTSGSTSGGSTGSTGTVPAFVAATQYQTATATQAGTKNGGTGNVSVGLSNAKTAGSTFLLMATSNSENSSQLSPGSGWTKIVMAKHGYGYVAAWYAPSASVSSTVSFSGLPQALNLLLIETSAASYEAWHGPLSGARTSSYGMAPNRTSKPSLAFGMMCSFNGGNLSNLSGATSMASFAGVGSGSNYWAGNAFSISNTASAMITATPTYTGRYDGQMPFGLIVNAFGATISGLGANYAYTPGLTPTPAVLPAPAAGRAQYYLDYVSRWKAGQTLPAPKVGMYNGPATQFVEKANFFYWLQRSVDVLEFAAFTLMVAVPGDSDSNNSMTASGDYAFGYQNALGARSENACFTIGLCTNDSSLYDVAAGRWDAVYATMAQNLIAKGAAGAEIRLGHEMNEGYYPFSAQNDIESYAAAFRRVVFIMRQQPGAQFLFSFCPLLVGYQQGSDPNNYLPGGDAVDLIAGDYYPSAYMYGGATDLATKRANADQHLWKDGSSSVAWMDNLSQQWGVPMTFPEFASGSNRDDGYGAGDDAYFLTEFHDWQKNNNKPVFRFMYWESSGGGTNSKMAPYDDGTQTLFPITAAQYLSYYRGPVLNAGFPARPAPPAGFTATGNLSSGFHFTYGAISGAGGAPQYLIVQMSEQGQNRWTSWNWLGLGSGQTASPNRGLDSGTTLVDVRMCFANDGGLSAWAQVTVNVSTGSATGSALVYSSAYGNNNTSIADPAIATPPAAPALPANTPTSASQAGAAGTPPTGGSTGSTSGGSTGGTSSTGSTGTSSGVATAKITDTSGNTAPLTLDSYRTFYGSNNDTPLTANMYYYLDSSTNKPTLGTSAPGVIASVVITENGAGVVVGSDLAGVTSYQTGSGSTGSAGSGGGNAPSATSSALIKTNDGLSATISLAAVHDFYINETGLAINVFFYQESSDGTYHVGTSNDAVLTSIAFTNANNVLAAFPSTYS